MPGLCRAWSGLARPPKSWTRPMMAWRQSRQADGCGWGADLSAGRPCAGQAGPGAENEQGTSGAGDIRAESARLRFCRMARDGRSLLTVDSEPRQTIAMFLRQRFGLKRVPSLRSTGGIFLPPNSRNSGFLSVTPMISFSILIRYRQASSLQRRKPIAHTTGTPLDVSDYIDGIRNAGLPWVSDFLFRVRALLE